MGADFSYGELYQCPYNPRFRDSATAILSARTSFLVHEYNLVLREAVERITAIGALLHRISNTSCSFQAPHSYSASVSPTVIKDLEYVINKVVTQSSMNIQFIFGKRALGL